MSECKTCAICAATLSVAAFGVNRRKADGLDYACKACLRRQRLDRLGRTDGRRTTRTRFRDEFGKVCVTCDQYLAWDAYHVASRVADGRRSTCKQCQKKANAVTYREKAARLDALVLVGRLPTGPKKCNTCLELKPRAAFGENVTARDGLRAQCRQCRRDWVRGWENGTRENIRTASRRRNYGVSPEKYRELFDQQDGRCAICGEVGDETKARGCLHVDHVHDSGEIRGLLCGRCNGAIGLLRDDVVRLERAIEYLKNPPART